MILAVDAVTVADEDLVASGNNVPRYHEAGPGSGESLADDFLLEIRFSSGSYLVQHVSNVKLETPPRHLCDLARSN